MTVHTQTLSFIDVVSGDFQYLKHETQQIREITCHMTGCGFMVHHMKGVECLQYEKQYSRAK